jgi:hypothetical protein
MADTCEIVAEPAHSRQAAERKVFLIAQNTLQVRKKLGVHFSLPLLIRQCS